MIETVARTILLADASIADLVGERVEFGHRPQQHPTPAIVLQDDAATTNTHLKGSTDGVERGTLRATCLAASYTAARELKALVLTALDKPHPDPVAGHRVTLRAPRPRPIRSDHRDGQDQPLTHGVQIDLEYRLAPAPDPAPD
ncbi:MAG: DUF3168 domain-containing protein, partial [Planctomycetota bacterium]